jgi:hypothetical protein
MRQLPTLCSRTIRTGHFVTLPVQAPCPPRPLRVSRQRRPQVSDDVWNDAADHFDEVQLGALLMGIATVNQWNRLNASTRQVAGAWTG